MANGYTVSSGAAFALSGTVAATIVNVIAGTRELTITELGVSFDGVTASAVPVLVELCQSTQATAGTPGASPTPAPIRPLAGGAASSCTAGVRYSAEPTVLTPVKQWLVTPNGGLFVLQHPLGREPGSNTSASGVKAIALRLTAPAGVNARAYIEVEE